MRLTRAEFQAVAETVLDDIIQADDNRKDPGWLDTIMRAADLYAATQAALAAIPAEPARGEPAP